MISLITYEDAALLRSLPSITDQVHKLHMQFTEARLKEALIARFGELPPVEEISAHCLCVIDHENVSHFMWFDVKPAVGECIDVSGALCSIAPPKIYTPKPE